MINSIENTESYDVIHETNKSTKTKTKTKNLQVLINSINKMDSNPYVIKLLSISHPPTLKNFLTSQDSFIDAIDQWSHLLGKMLSKVPSHRERLVIVENLYDEHGEGDLNKAHVNTFKAFIQSLDASSAVDLYNPNKKTYQIVRHFYEKLHYFIDHYDWKFSVAMLGMIELVYVTISGAIHKYAKLHLIDQTINHYSLHETLDTRHANELFALIKPFYENDPELIESGLKAGYDAMFSLYSELSWFL